MRDFIDKTAEKSGTPLNRENMMALQGFDNRTISFGEDGTIVETNGKNQIKTISINENGEIVERFEGEKRITKTTKFTENGKIVEVIS